MSSHIFFFGMSLIAKSKLAHPEDSPEVVCVFSGPVWKRNDMDKREKRGESVPSDLDNSPAQKSKEDVMLRRQDDPPDCWDFEFLDAGISLQAAAVGKPWKGAAAAFIPKAPVASKCKSAGSREVNSCRGLTLP